MKTFSIIVPVYYNALNLEETIPQLLNLGEELDGYKLELVFVDDGSGDQSLDILLQFQSRFPEIIKVVKLTRNFGSMAAIQAGLTVTSGDCIGMISADLQDPPELFTDMIKHWENGSKAVFAVRQDRDEPVLQKTLSNFYYALIRKYAVQEYPNGGFDYFLIDRQVAVEINRIQEKNTNLMTLIFWLGFKPVILPYIRRRREKGNSRWTLSKKIKLFVDTFVAFSYFPIRILSVIGFIVALSSFIYGGYILFYWLIKGVEVKGYVPSMLVMTFTSGIQMTMLGVLGEYLWRTLDETRRRPFYVIDEVFTLHRKEPTSNTDEVKR
jgi:polyisoprenyl-phosphate glycosyltransferase